MEQQKVLIPASRLVSLGLSGYGLKSYPAIDVLCDRGQVPNFSESYVFRETISRRGSCELNKRAHVNSLFLRQSASDTRPA